MEIPFVSTPGSVTVQTNLRDLFVPAAGAPSGSPKRHRVTQQLSIARHDWAADLLPDTAFVGAWLLLQARWLGSLWVELDETADASTTGEVPALRSLSVAFDTQSPVADWLRELDRNRRAPGTPVTPAAQAARATESLWLRHEVSLTGADAPPVQWFLRTDADGLGELGIDVASAWMDAPAAGQLVDVLAATAIELLARPDARLDAIATVTPSDRHAQLQTWNRAPSPYDRDATVHGLFSQQAARHPDRPAIEFGGQLLRYAVLERRSDALAAQLMARGVRVGDAVAVVLDRSIDAVVALLGVLKAGAAYVPIPTDFPVARIAAMLDDAHCVLAVVDARQKARLPANQPMLGLDEIEADLSRQATAASAAPHLPQVDGEALAYVMYTSGSTGAPKGIAICHRAILRLVVDACYVDLHPGDAMLHAAPLGFDASTLEIWGPLLTGGRCVVHDEEVPTGAGLARTISRHGVQTAWLTAALFNAVVDEEPAHLGGLRQLLTGGEALSVPHVRRALAALPHLVLTNGYGPTECTTFSATYRIERPLPAGLRSVPIGRPINDTVLRVLSPALALLPAGCIGELCIGGRGLARGYLNQPRLTEERFIADPFGTAEGQRLYRTGDLVRWLSDGTLEFIGRVDGQVKVRGHRIETGEVEAALLAHPAVRSCAVVASADTDGGLRLVAYLVARTDAQQPTWPALRAHLASGLPQAMLPAAHVWLDRLPVTANGKLDRRALPAPTRLRPELAQPFEAPRNAAETQVCEAFARALQLDAVGRADNFFDLGGDSLRVLTVLADLQRHSTQRLSTNLFFRQPTPQALALVLHGVAARTAASGVPTPAARAVQPAAALEPIALIATAGRFPGAADVEQFWDHLVLGRETIRFFDDQTLDAAVGQALRKDPAYVRARGVLDEIDQFDAAFFGIAPREADLMDPQQRVFLEICWECIERAGYVPDQCEGTVGVFGGMHNATYFQQHVATRPDLVEKAGAFQTMLGNEKDYVATRVANRLNLMGPAVSLNTACSTSLVAVVQAFHALRTRQCDMALAGGVSIQCPPNTGYLYEEGAMLSPDGHTRSFDAAAQGTVFSDGAAVVLLKRLSDALADGDTIHAVLHGAAINNDGGAKASFTAPGLDGQTAVIRAALATAQFDARSIGYVEAHGTATPMGDPIEVEALTRAYQQDTDGLGYCTLGSLKSNVGHMVIAAGAAGLIKAALALHHELTPPTVHFRAPNPAIDFEATPFRVSGRLEPWPRGSQPRRAAVSSFGVGGTNAHVVLEEAPFQAPSDAAAGPQVLLLSARSQAALDKAGARLADHLAHYPELSLADVAHTLRVGRKAFAFRSVTVADSATDAIDTLRTAGARWHAKAATGAYARQPVLMFPGQGAQYPRMGQTLRATLPVFREAFDACMDAFEGAIEGDLRACLASHDANALAATGMTQPATFAVEYALARQVLSLGLQPTAFIGHSVGEFVAAVLAGVMRLEDAARLVARRGALMQALPAGAMLSVRLPAATLDARLAQRTGTGLSIAADNAPGLCVVAGPTDAIAALAAELEAEGVACRCLQTSHAFHSTMMDAAVAPFEALVREVALRAPTMPIFSTRTGRMLEAAEATDPGYWAGHLRDTVRFSGAVTQALQALPHAVFVEVGPRNGLSTLVRQHGLAVEGARTAPVAVSVLGADVRDEARSWCLAAGQLWTLGAEIDLSPLDPRQRKLRVRLPTYPFERKRHWVDIAPALPAASAAFAASAAPLIPTSHAPSEPLMRTPASTSLSTSRRSTIGASLRTLFEDISGLDMSQAQGTMSFAELGLDSLTLTQAATQVKKQFKVNLSFRQLMESCRSLDALAAFVDQAMPAEAVEPAAASDVAAIPSTTAQVHPAARTAPAASTTSTQQFAAASGTATGTGTSTGAGSALTQLIAQQMQLMQQQLALLSQPLSAGDTASQPDAPATAPALAPLTAQPTDTPAPDAAEPTGPLTYDVRKAFGAIARIHTHATEPTDRQKVRLAAFIRRYVERTRKSKAFTVDNRDHMADPRVVNGFRPATKEITYQIVVERSKGSRLWDIDGNSYVDVLSGFGMNMFGWQPDFVRDAVLRQIDAGYEIGPQHPLAADVTRLICELTGFDRAGLCNTGSEAVMAALRIARTVTGRSTVVLFTGSYHGTFDEVLVRAGRTAKGIPAAPGVMRGAFGDVRVLEYGSVEAIAFIKENGEDIAAVLVEPVQSRRPDFQPREFLQTLRALTEQSGSCLIFDEVITGFRAALGGAQEFFGVRADLATYGKVIGGGFPVGVIAGRRDYMDALDGGSWRYGDDSIPVVGVTYFAGTFVRHPLALAAAKASLEHLKEAGPALQTALNLHTAAMADELNAFCTEVGAPLTVRYFASLWRVSWLEDHPWQDLLFAMMRSRGVHILDNFPCFLTTAHSDKDIAAIKSAFKESVSELQESGFLPPRPVVATTFDLSRPPSPDARLGRDKEGRPTWYVPDAHAQGHFVKSVS